MVSAVLQTSFLGDMVLTTPLIARLAEAGPVHVVATPANAGILANHPSVASVIVFDKRHADRGWRGMRRVARALRDTGAESAFVAQGSVRTALVARMAGIPHRIGFATSPGRWWYTRQVPFSKDRHHAERLLQLAAPVFATPAFAWHGSTPLSDGGQWPLRPSLYPGPQDYAAVNALMAEYAVEANTPLVVVAPGSVWATKRWPSYNALAASLVPHLNTLSARLVVIGGEGDRGLARGISAAVNAAMGDISGLAVGVDAGISGNAGPVPAVVDATGRLSLLASAALLARARVLVSNDSAPLHLASAMNTPTIALFGPTVPALGFGPLAEHSLVVEHQSLTCRPCGAHGPQTCPLGHWRCMRELGVDAVLDAVIQGTSRS